MNQSKEKIQAKYDQFYMKAYQTLRNLLASFVMFFRSSGMIFHSNNEDISSVLL